MDPPSQGRAHFPSQSYILANHFEGCLQRVASSRWHTVDEKVPNVFLLTRKNGRSNCSQSSSETGKLNIIIVEPGCLSLSNVFTWLVGSVTVTRRGSCRRRRCEPQGSFEFSSRGVQGKNSIVSMRNGNVNIACGMWHALR